MILLGIDLETTSTEPETCQIIEVGAVLYDWDRQVPVAMISELIDPTMDDVNAETIVVPPEVTEITGIDADLLNAWGVSLSDTLQRVSMLAGSAEYVMAHFGNQFDKPCLFKAYERAGWIAPKEPWLDSSCDIKYPAKITTRNLRYLAAEHGFLADYGHRAVFDVLTMLRIAAEYRIEDIVARAEEPMVYIQAPVKYDENQKAKDFSFRWNPEQKIWWKAMKQSDWMAERGGYQFKEVMLDKAPE